MLHTYEDWEGIRSSKRIEAIFEQPGLRRYRFVQVPINLQLFHVDIATGEPGDENWSRYVSDNFDDVIEFLAAAPATKVCISLQTRREDGKSYEIVAIKEIFLRSNESGRYSYLFAGADGHRYPGTYWQDCDGSDGDTELIWVAAA